MDMATALMINNSSCLVPASNMRSWCFSLLFFCYCKVNILGLRTIGWTKQAIWRCHLGLGKYDGHLLTDILLTKQSSVAPLTMILHFFVNLSNLNYLFDLSCNGPSSLQEGCCPWLEQLCVGWPVLQLLSVRAEWLPSLDSTAQHRYLAYTLLTTQNWNSNNLVNIFLCVCLIFPECPEENNIWTSGRWRQNFHKPLWPSWLEVIPLMLFSYAL